VKLPDLLVTVTRVSQTAANSGESSYLRALGATLTDMSARRASAPSGNASSPDSGRGSSSGRAGLEPRFLKLEDVAIYLSVSVAQAYALVRSGELPAIKVGGRGQWRIDKRQLEAYIERLHEETRRWAETHPLNPRDADGGA
jgi:excisionase family DNA binding protein